MANPNAPARMIGTAASEPNNFENQALLACEFISASVAVAPVLIGSLQIQIIQKPVREIINLAIFIEIINPRVPQHFQCFSVV